MSESHSRRRTLPAEYSYRRALGAAEQWQAVCIGASAGVVAYYIARLVLGRALLPRGGAPAARYGGGSGAERLPSPPTTGTARP